MDDKKICFITCVNNEKKYKEALLYINSLNVPQGYTVEAIAVEQAPCMTRGYNYAMSNTNAKYKIYLHQDVLITYKDFIMDVLNIFSNNPKLGMLGVAGSTKLDENCIWWRSNVVAQIMDNSTTPNFIIKIQDMDFESQYQKVECIDGLLMITQYDVVWRDDVFKAWHFYDISQSFEFRKQGYEVGVAKQKQTWCIHNCGKPSGDQLNLYRDIFVREYFL